MIRRLLNLGFIFIFMIFMAILFISGSISGCSGGSDVGNPENYGFKSDNDLKAYLVDQYSNSVLPMPLKTYTIDTPSTNDTPPGTHDTTSVFNAEEAGFSETNVQEAGVDESDKVKTDGAYIYIAGDTAVRIVDTAGETGMKKVGNIEINGVVDSLYLINNALVVLYTPEDGAGNAWQGREGSATDIGMPCWIPVNAKVGILIIDVSNPLTPETRKNIQMDGFLVTSRLTGGKLHIITQYFPDIPPMDIWYDGTESDLVKTVSDNRQLLAAVSLDDFIPFYEYYDDSGNMIDSGRLVDTQNFLRPADADGGTIVSIVSLDMADLSRDFSSVGLIADIHHVYASPGALYLASTLYLNTIASEAVTDGSSYQTRIYKFDLSQTPVAYKGSGQVQGHVLSQFSMGEYDNVVRIATTTGMVWDGSAKNHVYCLGEENGSLSVIGRLENLAPGERIYAARFIGTKGFLVTFVEIDPLLTLDLSDSMHPKVAGELKIPGYSTYIHPIGKNYLLTIGKDATTDANGTWYQGLQISLFNISDFSNPDLIGIEKIGDRGTESEALYNHKAFTFWAQENVFALPVNLYEHASAQKNSWDYGHYRSTDLYAYRITSENRIESLGRIPLSSCREPFSWCWTRSIFINDTIYAVNAATVAADPYLSIEEPFDLIDLTK